MLLCGADRPEPRNPAETPGQALNVKKPPPTPPSMRRLWPASAMRAMPHAHASTAPIACTAQEAPDAHNRPGSTCHMPATVEVLTVCGRQGGGTGSENLATLGQGNETRGQAPHSVSAEQDSRAARVKKTKTRVKDSEIVCRGIGGLLASNTNSNKHLAGHFESICAAPQGPQGRGTWCAPRTANTCELCIGDQSTRG